MADPVGYELRDGVALLRLDDGKANAISPALIETLGRALDRAEAEAGAVLLIGREGRFSGGFDLGIMRSGVEPARALVEAGALLCLRLFEFPKPVVCACTGHAVAAGAIVLLSADLRIGARGAFRIGLNEVAIGMALPIFGFELARQRLSKRHFLRATTQAELYAPDAAVEAGFLDRAVAPEQLFESAFADARRLAELPQPAFGLTKRAIHAEVAGRIRETLKADMARLAGPASGAGPPVRHSR